MMSVEECFFKTVMMMEKQLQGEDSFIYCRLINYCSNEHNINISPIIKIMDVRNVMVVVTRW
jgi:hypothetical protein